MKFWQLFTPTTLAIALWAPSVQAAEMIATQTHEKLGGGLNIYRIQLIDDSGQVTNTVRGVSGRVGKQIPSDRSGSQTPLPFGRYRFNHPGSVTYAGGEFGGTWSAITPLFKTDRSGIGLHYDPSAFKNNGQAGTAGCLATPTMEERDIMTEFIRTYRPTHITVQKAES